MKLEDWKKYAKPAFSLWYRFDWECDKFLEIKYYSGFSSSFKFISDLMNKNTFLIPLTDDELDNEKTLNIQDKINDSIIKLMDIDNDF